VIVADVNVRAPNSLLLLGDPLAGPPETIAEQLVSAAASCMAIATRSEADGETRVRVLDKPDAELRAGALVFDGVLDAPTGRLALTSVVGETYAEIPVTRNETRVQVWVNDLQEPDAIDLVIGAVEDNDSRV
jgi:hypothetical protein